MKWHDNAAQMNDACWWYFIIACWQSALIKNHVQKFIIMYKSVDSNKLSEISQFVGSLEGHLSADFRAS